MLGILTFNSQTIDREGHIRAKHNSWYQKQNSDSVYMTHHFVSKEELGTKMKLNELGRLKTTTTKTNKKQVKFLRVGEVIISPVPGFKEGNFDSCGFPTGWP